MSDTEDEHEYEDLDPRDALGVDEIVRRLPAFFTISVASRRNSGKSHLCRQLVQELIRTKKVDIVIVLSGTAGLNNDWSFLPPGCVKDFSEDILSRIWVKQRDGVLREDEDLKRPLVVLDDCLSTKEAIRSPILQKYYSEGRHVHASMIVISQHTSLLLTPVIRSNSDIILWSKLNQGQLEALWESTVGISKQDFLHISERVGGVNYNFLCLDNIIQSRDPMEFLTVVRATAETPKQKSKKKVK